MWFNISELAVKKHKLTSAFSSQQVLLYYYSENISVNLHELCVNLNSIRRFRDKHSSVIEVILVLTHSHWWGKADTPYMEYVVYIFFKISFAYFACHYILIFQNLMVDKLMISSDSTYDFGVFFKNCCEVVKFKDDIIKHLLNPIALMKTLVKHQLRVICIMGGLTMVFLSTRQKFELEIN